MAISVDWDTKVVTIHKADLDLVQLSPEIRQLNLGVLHSALCDLESGQPHPIIHTDTEPYVVSDVFAPRVLNFVNDYTVTFENGDYTTWVVGGATNIQVVLNSNDVVVELHNDEPECVDARTIVSNPAAPRLVNTRNLRPRIFRAEEL